MPIRLRITLFGLAVVALTLLLFSLLIYALAAKSVPAEQDRALAARAREAAARVERLPIDDLRATRTAAAVDLRTSLEVFVALFDAGGGPLSSTGEVDGRPVAIPPAVLEQAAARDSPATIEPAPGLRLRLSVRRWQRPDADLSGYVVAGQSLRHRGQQIRGLTAFLIVAAVFSLIAAAAAVWFAAGRALRPLKTVARTAEEIARTGDLGRRLPPARTRDEVRLLTDSFNGMLDRLQQTYHRLGRALESQRRFVADASHELRTPLATIRANTGFLLGRQDIADDDRAAALRDIAGESERMSRLVRDLLTLARADAGQHLERAPLDLVLLVREVCRQAEALYPSHAIALQHDDALQVAGNGDALTRLVWILLDNAAKHTPAGGHIHLWLGRQGALALLQVADEGPGIPPADLERIFDRFYRADAARTGDGAGLGLAIARWIVAEHGGRIRAFNRHGGGALFRVELPTDDGFSLNS
jgi:two-component system OmpR family sensor kinase